MENHGEINNNDLDATPQVTEAGRVKYLWANRAETATGGRDWRWSEYADPKEEARQLEVNAKESGLVHRHKLAKDCTGGFRWETASIIVQNPNMKYILDVVLEKYPDLTLAGRSTVEFQPPFKPMVSRWNKLLEFYASNIDPATKRAGDSLVPAFEPLVGKSALRLNKIKTEELVPFGEL